MTGLLPALAVLGALHAAPPDLRVEDGQFKDAQNRVVTLRGMNVAGDAKIPPFMPLTDEHMLDALQPLGINVIRLLFTWEAFEPTQGEYSQTYLDYYTQIIRWAHARGIATLVDFHQDAMSRVLVKGCGEGFPEWTVPPYAHKFAPDNSGRCSRWFASMWFDNDLWRAWRDFYADTFGVQKAYVAMAQRVAKHLAHEPGVIGYNLLNEPVGNETTELAPFYEAVGGAIREVHPTAILFLEPHVRVDVGLSSDLRAPSYGNIVYAPHFYDPVATVLQAYLGASFERAFADMLNKANELDAPLFLGEFGTSPDTRNALAYMDTMYTRFDDHFLSGAQWSYTPGWTQEHKDGWNTEDLSIVDGEGNLRPNFTARPYAQRIAGTPVRQRVLPGVAGENAALELAWIADPQAGDTEIFMPAPINKASELHFETSDNVQCNAESVQRVRCRALSPGLTSVRISNSLN